MIVGFSRPKKFKIFSKLIRWYLKTPYSHVYMKFYSKSLDRWIIYEAVGNGVRFIGKNLFEKTVDIVEEFEIPITDEKQIEMLQWCVDNSGVKYGCLQNIGIVVANILRLNKNPFKSGKNCSELIAEAIEHANIYKFNKDLNLVTPKEIYNTLLMENLWQESKD